MDTVLAGPGTYDENRIARALGYGFDRFAVANNPRAHGIHQRVDLKTIVKKYFAAHGRDPKSIAVIANSTHDAPHKPVGLGMFRLSESEAVELSNGPCAHGEDVSVDSPNPCCCPLVGLDRGGMVMGFNFEGTGKSIAYIHQACIFFARFG